MTGGSGQPPAPSDEGSPARAPAVGTNLSSLIEELLRAGARESLEQAPEARSGETLGRYELRREVGRGGFGIVWEARDRELGRTVALKLLRSPGEARERLLLSEAEVAARLSHPGIVSVLDVGRSAHGLFVVQEFLHGQTLAARLHAGRIPLRDALRISIEVARALSHAHQNGVVHRNLSAANVFLCDDGLVKVLDLGMAAALGRSKPRGGTPAYMAPEQAAGAPEDERTDVFAFGVLLFQMLTGRPPFDVDAKGHPKGSPKGLSVPEAPTLAALVEAMLAEVPVDRPRNAEAILAPLLEISRGLPMASVPVASPSVRWGARTRWWAAGFASCLAFSLVLGAGVASSRPGLLKGKRAVAIGARSSDNSCAWNLVARHFFEETPPGALVRNGQKGAQAPGRLDDKPVWLQQSDWNQLFVPLGSTLPDTFRVQALVRVPVARGANLYVFTDPVGPLDWTSSNLSHGRGVGLIEAKGKLTFEWGILDGMRSRDVVYKGDVQQRADGWANRWHTIRIEGSRSDCWARVSLDDEFLVAEAGHCDFDGRFLMLEIAGPSYEDAGGAWAQLLVSEGSPGCR